MTYSVSGAMKNLNSVKTQESVGGTKGEATWSLMWMITQQDNALSHGYGLASYIFTDAAAAVVEE